MTGRRARLSAWAAVGGRGLRRAESGPGGNTIPHSDPAHTITLGDSRLAGRPPAQACYGI